MEKTFKQYLKEMGDIARFVIKVPVAKKHEHAGDDDVDALRELAKKNGLTPVDDYGTEGGYVWLGIQLSKIMYPSLKQEVSRDHWMIDNRKVELDQRTPSHK